MHYGIFSLYLSPYIQNEAVLATDCGQLYTLSSAGDLSPYSHPRAPRFAVSDGWNSACYGAHPRELFYCDQTVLQALDLRVGI